MSRPPKALPKPVPAHTVSDLIAIIKRFGLKEEMDWICNRYFVRLSGVLQGNRSRGHQRARAELCVMLRRKGLSLIEIGKMLGIHHTTVLNAVQRASAELVRPKNGQDSNGS